MIGDRYSLDRKIGQGGMGTVWLGRDEVLGRPVAIKRVGVAPGASSPDLLRAEREAKIAASLNHPHVVGVFDLVVSDDDQWLVMEYVAGTTLAEMVRTQGALPVERVTTILAQATSALAAAHAAGIVHRDVKPSNILVREDGDVKISDFGIARSNTDVSLTQTGLVTGSPAYLAPEVASGRLATSASDMWSLGATAFHALAGHPPYDVGDNVLGALYRIVNEPPPRLPSAGPLAALIEATLVTDPAQRWTAEEATSFLESKGAPTTPRSAPRPVVPFPSEDARGADTQSSAEPRQLAPEPAASSPVASREPTPRGRVLPALIGVLVLALVVVILILALQKDPQQVDPSVNGPVGPSTSAPTTPSSSPTSPSTSPAPQPKAKDMQSFVADYLNTAASDPAAAFRSLTPAFQNASGGRVGYERFWGSVSDVRLLGKPKADPDGLTVSYHYSYVRQGLGKQQDRVTLQLTFDNGTYLIAGESDG